MHAPHAPVKSMDRVTTCGRVGGGRGVGAISAHTQTRRALPTRAPPWVGREPPHRLPRQPHLHAGDLQCVLHAWRGARGGGSQQAQRCRYRNRLLPGPQHASPQLPCATHGRHADYKVCTGVTHAAPQACRGRGLAPGGGQGPNPLGKARGAPPQARGWTGHDPATTLPCAARRRRRQRTQGAVLAQGAEEHARAHLLPHGLHSGFGGGGGHLRETGKAYVRGKWRAWRGQAGECCCPAPTRSPSLLGRPSPRSAVCIHAMRVAARAPRYGARGMRPGRFGRAGPALCPSTPPPSVSVAHSFVAPHARPARPLAHPCSSPPLPSLWLCPPPAATPPQRG
jgi:hypothetical protein